MVSFPNCKINLGLKILRKREDGFHDLETIFYPLPLRDILETVPSPELQFTPTGRAIPGEPGENLTVRAWQLLRHDFPGLPFVHIHLHKQIPIGGGLGGGSADGAFILVQLNRQFRLGLDTERLAWYAAQLGSDCPFFLLNKPCVGRGRGERLEALSLDLSGYSFLLIDPGLHISTAEAFSRCRPDASGLPLQSIIAQPVARWRGTLTNDFEVLLFDRYPILGEIKQSLYERGALYAAMTGSGSCLYGIFEKGRIPVFPHSQKKEYLAIN